MHDYPELSEPRLDKVLSPSRRLHQRHATFHATCFLVSTGSSTVV
jgi:hypothetical protein